MTTRKALEDHYLGGYFDAEPVAKAHFEIVSVRDILEARIKGREMALWLGFSHMKAALIAVTVSELARNIAQYASPGQITLAAIFKDSRYGMLIVARDHGPGIPDVDLALQEGYSTSSQLGMGLTGVHRAMDEFSITSGIGEGTVVTAVKWLR
jgi:serine/threonine-protein kinase RsbT